MMWEIVLIWCQVICAFLLYILILANLRKYRRMKMLKEIPDAEYIFFRYRAKQVLKCKMEKSKLDNLDKLKSMISELICAELDLPFLAEETDVLKVNEKETEIKKITSEIWKKLIKKIPPELVVSRTDDVLKAFFFELDSGLIVRPSDVLGRRRAYRFKSILLDQIKANSKSAIIEAEQLSEQKITMNIFLDKLKATMRRVPGLERAFPFLSLPSLFVQSVVFTLVILVYDVKTDVEVINKFYSLTHEGPVNITLGMKAFYSAIFDGSSGYNLKRITDLPESATGSEVRKMSLINTFVRIYYSSYLMVGILCISSVVILPTFPTLVFLFNIDRKMKLSETERKNKLNSTAVMHRYNLSRSESGVESTLEMVFQMASFLAMSWELAWLAMDQADLIFPDGAIWQSYFMSMLAISLAQYKTRMVLHGFSTNLRKKMIYLLACFLNTLSASLVWISLGMGIMDLITFGGYEVSSGGGDVIFEDGRLGSKTIYYGIIMSYCFIIIIMCFSNMLRLPSSSVSPDLVSTNSVEFHRCLMKQLFFLSLLFTWNGMLSIYLFRFAKNTLTPALVRQGSRFLPSNSTIIADGEFLTPSNLGRSYVQFDRQNFSLLYPILMPSCYVMSYSLLLVYFKDNYDSLKWQGEKGRKKPLKRWRIGTRFSKIVSAVQCCVGFWYAGGEGYWLDLADLECGKGENYGDQEDPFTTCKEKIDQATLDSVLRTLPAWHEWVPCSASLKS